MEAMQVILPESFSAELKSTIKEIYKEAYKEAKRECSLNKEYLTIEETCQYLSISRSTLNNNFIMRGLPLIKVEGKNFISKSDIDAFLNNHKI